MALDIFKEKGRPLEDQKFTWRDLVRTPPSKLDSDAFTRVRIILMNGIEAEAVRFQHAAARMNGDLQQALARVRRVEHHQQTMVNWLLAPDLSPLETTIGFEQVAIEITGAVAQQEPDPYLALLYRFGMLEDFDHLYRFAALMDRVEGKDANDILQSYTDVRPGRPTSQEHRHPDDDLRKHYDRTKAQPLTKINATTIMAAEHQTHDYYMTIGPMFSDPVARQLYAEIASIEEQHVTQYESMIDPNESVLEKWLIHEATEVYNYLSCAGQEDDPEVRSIWERFVDYELGHLHFVMDLFKKHEGRDPAEVLPSELPEALPHTSQRAFVREVLKNEVDLRAVGTEIVPPEQESERTREYRDHLNSEGSPSEAISKDYRWTPGTELVRDKLVTAGGER